ncbi:unnamed protein product [Adineta steineri]|uniref:Spermatogenesis-associated protein 6 N-terminal domain-containing protein n=1 Tax=Adineta steineri TaxID=433720 RepID=A0A813P7Y2_9BILA|nr:unnamed protein product [Adineta steineri]CAF0740374.1 unnamed protein product [Adineta steineri]CAF0750309.1 unnamed protein product [Adineta steineri]
MAKSGKAYRYSVEMGVHAVDAPGTRLTTKGDLYINICLLGIHKRTRMMPPYLPINIDQTFIFDKTFKSCYDSRDIIERLKREHVLIELLQSNGSSPILLASYETSAKDFLYPHSWDRIEYTGSRRYVLLSRTIEFPGVSPSFEFTLNPCLNEGSGTRKVNKSHKQTKPIDSYGKSPKRAKSPVWKPSSAYPKRISSSNNSPNVSRSLTSHTISSAVKNDYSHRETQEKLRELAIPGEVKYVVELDKTIGRKPFVVRHVNDNLIGRKPKSHVVLNEGLVVNDYSLSRAGSLTSLHDGSNRSRSVSPVHNRSHSPIKVRTRSPSPSRRPIRSSQSFDFEQQGRSITPERRSNLYNNDNDDYHNRDDEFHSTEDCAICRLHRIHSAQSQRAKSLEQRQFATISNRKSYAPDIYSSRLSRPITSATLLRDSFRYRHQQSPAGDLSDKVIHTLRRNLDSYSAQPWHNYYSAFRYSDGHVDDDELLERSRRLMEN